MSSKEIEQSAAWFLEHMRPGSTVSIVAETQERAVELAAQVKEILAPHRATVNILTVEDLGVDLHLPESLKLVAEKIHMWRQRCWADNEIAIFARSKAGFATVIGSYIWTQGFEFALEETPDAKMYLHKALGIVRPSGFNLTC